MERHPQPPTRLASEDVIISAPLSYVGSAQRIMRIRRRAVGEPRQIPVTVLAVVLVILAWVFVTVWYLVWGIWLVPYRLLRRGARKRKLEAMRHRELMGTIQGSAAASAAAIVAAIVPTPPPPAQPPGTLIGDADRDHATDELRRHMLAGRLSAEEFEERLTLVYRARARADLDAAQTHLPLRSQPTGR